jgi:lipopolysaccharide export LptBFGC system permease protein LptF
MEITAFKSSGIHMFRLIAPVLILGLLLTGLMIYFNDRILPTSNFAYKKTYFKILQRQANIAIREKVWIDKFENYRFLIDRQNSDGTFSNIKAFNKWSTNTSVQTTLAQTGYLETNQSSFQVFFHLNDGVLSWDNANFHTYNRLYFEHYIINLKLENQLAHLSDVKKDFQEMTLNEIAQAIPLEKDPGRHNFLKTEYQKRLALPFACLVLAWFCAPLGLWTKSKGFLGFSLGLALIFVYYLMFILGETLSNQGAIDPRLGLWWANLVLAALGGLIYYLVVSEHSAFRGMPPLPRRRSTTMRGTP